MRRREVYHSVRDIPRYRDRSGQILDVGEDLNIFLPPPAVSLSKTLGSLVSAREFFLLPGLWGEEGGERSVLLFFVPYPPATFSRFVFRVFFFSVWNLRS